MKRSNSLIFLLLFLTALSCDYKPYAQGEILYNNFCASCHGADGEGFLDLYPPVADADYFQKDPYAIACFITYGFQDSILVNGKVYNQPMLAIENLNHIEITNILNFMAHTWNPGIPTPLHQDSVKQRIEACKDWKLLN